MECKYLPNNAKFVSVGGIPKDYSQGLGKYSKNNCINTDCYMKLEMV